MLVEAKRRRRRASSAPKAKVTDQQATDKKQYVDDEIEEEIVQQDDINKKINTMNKNLGEPQEMTDEEYEEFKIIKGKEQAEAMKNLYRAKANHGEDTRPVADALHRLGKVLYEQVKFEEAFEVAKEVLRIHTKLYGPDDEETMKALGNFGSVACRMNRQTVCDLVMYRMMDIAIKLYGKESKQALLQRGRLLTFKVPHGDKHEGIDQEMFEDEIAEAYEELAEQKKAKEAAKTASSEQSDPSDGEF